MTYNSGLMQVTVTEQSQVNPQGEPVTLNFVQSGAGTSTLGTVPAGKKWLITRYQVSMKYAVGAGRGELKYHTHVLYTHYCNGTYDDTVNTENISLESCPVALAGETITAVVTTNGGIEGSVSYIEVNA